MAGRFVHAFLALGSHWRRCLFFLFRAGRFFRSSMSPCHNGDDKTSLTKFLVTRSPWSTSTASFFPRKSFVRTAQEVRRRRLGQGHRHPRQLPPGGGRGLLRRRFTARSSAIRDEKEKANRGFHRVRRRQRVPITYRPATNKIYAGPGQHRRINRRNFPVHQLWRPDEVGQAERL